MKVCDTKYQNSTGRIEIAQHTIKVGVFDKFDELLERDRVRIGLTIEEENR